MRSALPTRACSASASGYWRNFAGAPLRNTWYPRALANKLAGVNLVEKNGSDPSLPANMDIKTQFNVNLGNAGCLDGTPFYLGLDGNAGAAGGCDARARSTRLRRSSPS